MTKKISVEKILASRKSLPKIEVSAAARDEAAEGGCGVIGIACSEKIAGRHLLQSLIQMRNRGNGKGGGIAAVGLIPEEFGVSQKIMEEDYQQRSTDIVKVVLFGPESTGKTTLAMLLAQHYNTVWVPEFAREFLQQKWDEEQVICEEKDLLPIARGQMRLENELAEKANQLLICDTDLLETKVYSESYYVGSCDPILEKYALENQYNLYFLTYIDTPWEADDLRDKPNERLRMFKAFEQELIKQNRPYVILKGDKKTRINNAVKHIDKLLKAKE